MDPVNFATPRGYHPQSKMSQWSHYSENENGGDSDFIVTPKIILHEVESMSGGGDDSPTSDLECVADVLAREPTVGVSTDMDNTFKPLSRSFESRPKSRLSECKSEGQRNLEKDRRVTLSPPGNDLSLLFTHTAESIPQITGSTPSLSSMSTRTSSSQGSSNKRAKRLRHTTEDSSSDDQNHKLANRQPSHRYACPFRKHDPQKYDLRKHPNCANSHWASTSRIKEHIYRSHRAPLHCLRCGQQFNNNSELGAHVATLYACGLIPREPPEGITSEMEDKLRIRKKAHQSQTEVDRWMHIYQILFPYDRLPDTPYFEPIQEEAAYTPGSIDLDDYASYSREELPRVVRSYIRTDQEVKAMGIDDLVFVIQNCQDQLISDYTSRTREKGKPVEDAPSVTGSSRRASRTPDSNTPTFSSEPAMMFQEPFSYSSFDPAGLLSENMPWNISLDPDDNWLPGTPSYQKW